MAIRSSTLMETITNLTNQGVPSDAEVNAIIGGLKAVKSLTGSSYLVKDLPPYGMRVIMASGNTFQSTIHGDIQ